jgi:membrane protein
MKNPNLWTLLKDTFHDWSEDKAARLAAALSYYTLFSLAPLLVIAIAIAGFFFSRQQAENQIVTQIGGLVGPSAASAIQGMIGSSRQNSSNVIATIVGVALLLVGASGVFGSLQDALNTIWEVRQDPKSGVRATLINRIFSFAMVLGIGFLLLVSLIISAALTAVGAFFQNQLPAAGSGLLFGALNFVVSFVVITLLFALIFKILPDVSISWRDVWIGAAFTALLFTIGKSLIGIYLGRSSVTSVYGAAGSLVVILLWVYYSALILFFGVEFTQVFTHVQGREVRPIRGAVWMTPADLANQGISRSRPRHAGAQPVPRRAPSPAAGYAAGLIPAMAVAGAGQGDREIDLSTYQADPQSAASDRPEMPGPVRVLTGVLGSLAAAIGVSALLFTRSRGRPDQRLIREGKALQEKAQRLLEEAGQVRTQARQMHTSTSRLDSLVPRLRKQGQKVREAGQKAIERGKRGS